MVQAVDARASKGLAEWGLETENWELEISLVPKLQLGNVRRADYLPLARWVPKLELGNQSNCKLAASDHRPVMIR